MRRSESGRRDDPQLAAVGGVVISSINLHIMDLSTILAESLNTKLTNYEIKVIKSINTVVLIRITLLLNGKFKFKI